MLNHVSIMGRLTRDPELRRTQSGTPVTSFSLACERDFKTDAGERVTDFIEVVAWRGTAEMVCKYFSKGRMAAVSGRLQVRAWKDKDGNNRKTVEVLAESVYFADSKREDSGGYSAAPSAYGAPAAAYTPTPAYAYTHTEAYADTAFAEIDDEDGDLPF